MAFESSVPEVWKLHVAAMRLWAASLDFSKASPDDPVRPGWPAGTPGGVGGRFRPKDKEPSSRGSSDVWVRPNKPPPQGSGDISHKLVAQSAKVGVRWLARSGLLAAEIAAPEVMIGLEIGFALAEFALPYIKAYFVPPKSLAELNQAADDPQLGYDVHHIVEQATAATDGSERARIEGADNLTRIPTLKHWELNGWYQRSNRRLGGLSPRSYLREKSWNERRKVGLEGLTEIGVLK